MKSLFPDTDLRELRGWLDRRQSALKAAREPHEALWRELAEHYEPDLGRALLDEGEDAERRSADPRDGKLLTSTPRTELRRMAAAMKSGTANESRQWFRLRVKGQDRAQTENPAWTMWLDHVTRNMSALLDQSNAYSGIGQLFLHCILFGAGAGVVSGGHPDDILDLSVIDTGAWWGASTRRNRVDVLMRRVAMTAREALTEFGERRSPEAAVRACKEGRDEQRFIFWNLISPRDGKRTPGLDGRMAFSSIWWSDARPKDAAGDSAGIVDIRGYSYNPILCPRWDILEGFYASGPGRIGLPDVRELYRLELDSLKAIAQRVDPPLAAPDSMEGRPINTFPGGVTYYAERLGGGAPVIQPLVAAAPDVQAVEHKIKQVEARLRRVFYADLFNAVLNVANTSNVQMTARQVEEMSGEKISLLGPVLTNLNHGLFDPLIDAVFAVMVENGLVPEPPEGMQGEEIQAEYVSTLHMRQQEEARLGGIMRFSQFAGGILQLSPESADKIDADQMLDEAAQALAVPGSCIRSDRDVQRIREERAEAQRAQMEAAAAAEAGRQAPGYADALKTLAETPAGGASALEALVGAAGQTNGGMI